MRGNKFKKKIPVFFSQEGFTLIEILLALGLFSLIALTVFSVFFSGLTIEKISRQNKEIYRDVFLALDSLAVELVNMVDYNSVSLDGSQRVFSGGPDFIRFVLPEDEGLSVVQYSLDDETGESLVRTQEDIRSFLSGRRTDQKKKIISSAVPENGFRLFYGYREENSESIVWRNSWQHNFFPAYIRVIRDVVLSQNKKTEKITLTKDIFVPTGYIGRFDE